MQEGIFDEFSEAVVEKVNKLKLGGGMDPNTTLGPLISQAAVERVCPGYTTIMQLIYRGGGLVRVGRFGWCLGV